MSGEGLGDYIHLEDDKEVGAKKGFVKNNSGSHFGSMAENARREDGTYTEEEIQAFGENRIMYGIQKDAFTDKAAELKAAGDPDWEKKAQEYALKIAEDYQEFQQPQDLGKIIEKHKE